LNLKGISAWLSHPTYERSHALKPELHRRNFISEREQIFVRLFKGHALSYAKPIILFTVLLGQIPMTHMTIINRMLKFPFLILFATVLISPLVAQKPASKEDNNGLLFEISGNGLKKPSYIFGTFHILCPTDVMPMDKFAPYIDKSDQLIMEIDMDDPAVTGSMAKGAAISDGRTLSQLLTPEQYAKVDEMFKNNIGVSVDAVKMLKPAILSVLIVTSPKMLGCGPPSSYDLSLVKVAGEKKKPIIGLETVEFQSKMLESQPLEKQAESLVKMADDPQKSEDELKKLIATYKEQDIEKLHTLAVEQEKDDIDFQKDLLDDRNAAWIPKIESNIKTTPSFIAVGAGHLGGPKGVISLLRAKGYKVTPIRL
jgi:uncharacterized protein YbaP (TraB family)